MKNLYFCLATMAGALLLAAPTSTGAEAAPQVKLAKMRCVHIFRHLVRPLRSDDRVDDDHLRCTVGATNQGSEPVTLKMALRLEQAAFDKGDKPVKLEEQQEISLGTGEVSDAEITLAVSDGWNGCMPYTLIVTVGNATIKKAFTPNCSD